MPRLLILVATELTRDPRARRQAETAVGDGYDVVGLCLAVGDPAPLDGVQVVRTGVRRAWSSGAAVGAREHALVRELRGLYRIGRWMGRTARLVRAGRRLGRFDVVHANDLDTLPASFMLARGARVVYDAHELYSEFDQRPPRLQRRLALAVERALARRAGAVTTVSEPLAAELQHRLRLRMAPRVVHNAPRIAPEPPHGEGALHAVYQGGFGPGRVVDDLVAAARAAPDVHFTIRALEGSVSVPADNVEVVAPVAPANVIDALAGQDVGIIFDRPLTRNSELSMPNKLFEYLMAGLAVSVSDLPALAAFVREHGVGVVFPAGRPEELAQALRELARDRAALSDMQARARDLALSTYNAEAQAAELLRAWRG